MCVCARQEITLRINRVSNNLPGDLHGELRASQLKRLRFRRMTQRGPVWFVEAMFPGYLFAKFVYSTQHRAVENSHGIRGIVHFGDRLATLPENVVTALQSRVGSEEVVTLDCSIKVGQSVQIIDGPFQGLDVVGTHLLPAKERVRVLFDFLGRSVEMEVSTAKVLAA